MISYSFISNLTSYFHTADPETLSDRDLFDTAQKIGAVAIKSRRAFIGLLPLIERRRAYEGRTFYSIYDFAAKAGGVGRDVVTEVLRLDAQLQNLPLIRKLLYGGRVGWTKIRTVTHWLMPENQEQWIEKLENLSSRALETYIRDFRKQQIEEGVVTLFAKIPPAEISRRELTTGNSSMELLNNEKISENKAENFHVEILDYNRAGIESQISSFKPQVMNPSMASPSTKLAELSQFRETFTFSTNSETAARLRLFRQRLEKDRRELVTWEEVMVEFLKMIEGETRYEEGKREQKKMTERTEQSTEKPTTRYIPAATRHQITAQYNGLCAFKNCTQPATTLHHTKRFALTKHLSQSETHDSRFIKPLCTAHERIVHNTLVENEEIDPTSWKLLATPELSQNPTSSLASNPASDRAAIRSIDQQVSRYRKPK